MAETSTDIGPLSQVVDGVKLPWPFSPQAFRSAVRYEPRPDDVFVATYPKCGTTWVQHALVLIFSHGESVLSAEKFFSAAPFLELGGAASAETMPRPGAIKTHLPYDLTPRSSRAKYIHVTRNPKDCCVSYYHHVRDLPGHNFTGTFDQFFEMFLSGDVYFGDYFDHLLGWHQHRNDSNVLSFTYEDMSKDPAGTILKMASFIDDEKYAKPLRQDPDKLSNAVRYSSFEHMRDAVNKGMDQMMTMTKEDFLKSEFADDVKDRMAEMFDKMMSMDGPKKAPAPCTFVRKGVVGDWRNYFSEDQSRRLDQKFAERTNGTEIQGWWTDCMRFVHE